MSNIVHSDQSVYLESTIIERDPLLLEMEKLAAEMKIPILERTSANFLEQLILLYNPKSFLEIGMAIGYSTIRVAKISNFNTQIDSIELSKPNIQLAKQFFGKAGLVDRINILEGRAQEILKSSKSEYDFIFLDADKEDYLELFILAKKLLNLGGVILIDNLLWKGFTASREVPEAYKKSTELIRKFNAQFLSDPNFKSSILPIGDGLGLGLKIN